MFAKMRMLGLCMGETSTRKIMDNLCTGYDDQVIKKEKNVEKVLHKLWAHKVSNFEHL